MELLGYETMSGRRKALSGRDQFWLEGAIRAVMQARGCEADVAGRLSRRCADGERPAEDLRTCGGASLRPCRGPGSLRLLPTAYAVGFILAPLRGCRQSR